MPTKKSPSKARAGAKKPVNKRRPKAKKTPKPPKPNWERVHPHAEAIKVAAGGLDNPTHEAFAQKVAQGLNATEAYRAVTGKNGPGAKVIAHRWLTKTNSRIKELQAASATAATLTMQERREFIARLVRTPIALIDEHNPLCQFVKYVESESGRRVEYKVADKLAAIMDDAKLAGELIEKKELSGELRVPMTLAEFEKRLAGAELEYNKHGRAEFPIGKHDDDVLAGVLRGSGA